MYKPISIRDARQSLEINTSLWRLSWITFIFLPLTFLAGIFGMNVSEVRSYPSMKWYDKDTYTVSLYLQVYQVFHSHCALGKSLYTRLSKSIGVLMMADAISNAVMVDYQKFHAAKHRYTSLMPRIYSISIYTQTQPISLAKTSTNTSPRIQQADQQKSLERFSTYYTPKELKLSAGFPFPRL